MGTIAIVVKAMNTHMDNTDLILQGCNTLINTTVSGIKVGANLLTLIMN